MVSRSGSPTGPIWREMPVSRIFLYISFRVSSKGPSKYFVDVRFKIMKFLITQCSPTACNSYLVPNIVFRNLFGLLSFSENSSALYSPQKTLRSKYRSQKAARSSIALTKLFSSLLSSGDNSELKSLVRAMLDRTVFWRQ